jgi:hypothetical protein
MFEELEGTDELIPMDQVNFVWPPVHSCTNEHFNDKDKLAYQDAHSVEIKPFCIEDRYYDSDDWKTFVDGLKPDVLSAKTFKAFDGKKTLCFILMEMSVHQTLSDHAEQKKKSSKEEQRKTMSEQMKKKNKKAASQKTKKG